MIKVLAMMYDEGAVAYHRMGWPAKHIHKNHSDDVTMVFTKKEFDPWDIQTLKQFDIIHFHKYFGRYESSKELWGKLQAHGVKMVMDLDDYWDWPENMPVTKRAKEIGLHGREIENLKLADYVTVTTRHLAELVKEYNPNVMVLPNGLDVKHEMWQDTPSPSDVIRIGWAGSLQRGHDLEVLRKGVQMLYSDKDLEGKFMLTLCGDTGENSDIFEGPGFVKHEGLHTSMYGHIYDNLDVCLAPLQASIFNSCRSELKYVEAGVRKKVFIGQNHTPYAEDIKHGVNGMLVDRQEEWYSCMRQVILDKELREKLRNNLHLLVKDKFDITNLARERVQFYKSITNHDD
jgi:glycosyltransferase involved in cell wall biosynthesis